MNPLVEVGSAHRTLTSGAKIFSHVNFHGQRSESISIVGSSGSGKSTLLACLGLIAPFDHGSLYRLGDHEITAMRAGAIDRVRGNNVGFVLQNSGLVEHLNALQNVMAPFMHRRDVPLKAARTRAQEALSQVGLSGLENRRPHALSGGERQRVAIARAIVAEPALILADEPTGALDIRTGSEVIEHLIELVHALQSCLVVVTHDPEIATRTNRQYRIEAGTLTEITP